MNQCDEKECDKYNEAHDNNCKKYVDINILIDELCLKANKDAVAKLHCSDGLDAPAVDEEMLARAMKKAVEVGIFPKHPVDTETYLKRWAGMKAVLQTAVGN